MTGSSEAEGGRPVKKVLPRKLCIADNVESSEPRLSTAKKLRRGALLGAMAAPRRCKQVTALILVLLLVCFGVLRWRWRATLRVQMITGQAQPTWTSLKAFMEDQPPLRESGSPQMIPRIVHQSWRSKRVPDNLVQYAASWRTKQPDWQYVLHSDMDNANLVAERYPWLASFFSTLTGIQRADVSRLLYMHAYGGVYADLDVELLQPLDGMLSNLQRESNCSAMIGQEPLAHSVLLESKPRQCCNAVLVSSPGLPFWLWTLRQIQANGAGGADPVGTTGPRMLETVVVAWQAEQAAGRDIDSICVAKPEVFFPTWDPMQVDVAWRGMAWGA